MCAVSKEAEDSFKQMVEVDRLIDMLRDADNKEVSFSYSINVVGFVLLYYLGLCTYPVVDGVYLEVVVEFE